MIDIVSIYEDVIKDNVNADENGTVTISRFNRLSKRAELRLLDYLSGDVENQKPPIPYLAEKNKDWLSSFIAEKEDQVTSGFIKKPDDYYSYENLSRIGGREDDCDDDDDEKDDCSTTIDMLTGTEFNVRCRTDIKELRPSMDTPIVKLVGDKFYFMPKDLGTVKLEYVRYPKFGKLKSVIDPLYNKPIVTVDTPYQWPEFSRELLTYFITDFFTLGSRERALKESNIMTGKLVRDGK